MREGGKEEWYARDSVSPQSRLELPFVTCRFRTARRAALSRGRSSAVGSDSDPIVVKTLGRTRARPPE